MATLNDSRYPNCDTACDRCGSPLLPLNCIAFEGISAETGDFVKGVYGPDCIYRLTGDKNPRYNTVRGIYNPSEAQRIRDEQAQTAADEQAEVDARYATWTPINQWLIDTLSNLPYHSDFAHSTVVSLRSWPFNKDSFSLRQIEVIAEIYAKQHGRRNSKAYCAAYDKVIEFAGIE